MSKPRRTRPTKPAATSPLPEPAPPSRRAALAMLALAGAVFLAHAWTLRAFVIDDAYITFRYARDLASGLGLVFNPGERVEGFSNPLFTLLLAALAPLARGPEALPALARALGVIAGLGTLAVVAHLRLRGGDAARALAAFAIAANTSFALWAVGGLETIPYACLIVAAVALGAAPAPRTAAAQVLGGLLLAAIALSRPEGIVIAGVLALARLLEREARRDAAALTRFLAAAALPVVAYVAFRRATYGEWLPNTYFAKHIPLGLAIPRGLTYLGGFFTHHARGFAFAPALLTLRRAHRSRATSLALAVLAAYAVAVVFVGGDWMDEYRFMAPVVPLLALPLAEGAWAAWEWLRERTAAPPARGALCGALALVMLAALALPEARSTTAERGRMWVDARPYYVAMGRVVAQVAAPDWTVAAADVGAIGWYGRVRVLDLLGLTHHDLARGLTWDAALVGERQPEIVILHHHEDEAPHQRWRTLRIRDFDAHWPAPDSPVPLPGAFRVRADVRDSVEARLARMSGPLRRDLAALDAWLATHQPDGLPLPPGAPRQ